MATAKKTKTSKTSAAPAATPRARFTELWNAVDPIAERIRSLGHPAPGSYAQFGALTSLKNAP